MTGTADPWLTRADVAGRVRWDLTCALAPTMISGMDTTHTFHIHTTRRIAHVDAANAEQAVAVFTGREVAPSLLALGPFPDFDADPDGWRAHLARYTERRQPALAWPHGECMNGDGAYPCDCPDAATRAEVSRFFDAW